MARTTICKHPERKHYAHGLCQSCYMADRNRTSPADRIARLTRDLEAAQAAQAALADRVRTLQQAIAEIGRAEQSRRDSLANLARIREMQRRARGVAP
jgi:uncharacterized protein YlxW (UPF0749 family)